MRLILAVVLALSAHARLAVACDDDVTDVDDDDDDDEDVAADPADNVRVDVLELRAMPETDAIDDDDSNWDGNDGCS